MNNDIVKDLQRVAGVVGQDLITRAQYREHGNFTDHALKANFGTFRAARRAAGLEESLGSRHNDLALSRYVDADAYRQMNIDKFDYADKFRKPKGTRFQTILVASDVHDECCDPFWRRVFIDTVLRVQPDTVVLGGDIFDLMEMGRYTIDPREWDIVGKIKWVHEFLGDIRESAPNAEIVFVEGNHEFRAIKYITDNAPTLKVLLSDLHGWTVPKLLGLDKYEVRYIARADLAATKKTNVVDEIKKNYVVLHNCVLVDHFLESKSKGVAGFSGHHHRHFVWTEYSHHAGSYEWHQLGCGHRRQAEYCGAEKWNMGFATVHVDTQNERPIIDYHYVGDFTNVHGKYYLRNPSEL